MDFQLIYLLSYCGAYLLLIYVSEQLHKRGIPSEYTRKSAHILSTLLALPLYHLFPNRKYVFALIIITFFILWAGNRFKKFDSINRVGRVTHGAYLLPLGIGIAFLISDYAHNENIYLISISVLALSDPLAFMGGRFFAPAKAGTGKTFAGSFVFFFSSLLITFFILLLRGAGDKILILAAGTAIVSTIAEFFSPKGTDNITVPLFIPLYLLMAGI